MNFSRNLDVMLLIGSILASPVNTLSTELISPTPYAKTMAASIVDSFEQGKPTRAFISTLKFKDMLRMGLGHICDSDNLQVAEQEFFSALKQVFSGETPNVTNEAVDLILKSAKNGCSDANEIVIASSGKAISEIAENFFPTLREAIRVRLQDFIDKSSSDDEDFDSAEIQQLKSYLQIPQTAKISLIDLKRARAELDISIAQALFETPIISDGSFKTINNTISFFLSAFPSDSRDLLDSAFLYVLMRMFINYPCKLDGNIIKRISQTIISKEMGFSTSDSDQLKGEKLYKWLEENDEGILGEYHI